MEFIGECKCKNVRVTVVANVDAAILNPRVCDCDYCRAKPAAVISHPTMKITVNKSLQQLKREQNGAELADFYRCLHCDVLIVVGCEIDGVLRGAVNAGILKCDGSLGETVAISPKKLNAEQKLQRWGTLWGELMAISES